jgi:hypothetical protein
MIDQAQTLWVYTTRSSMMPLDRATAQLYVIQRSGPRLRKLQSSTSLKAPCEAEATQASTSGPSHLPIGFPLRELEYDASGLGVSRSDLTDQLFKFDILFRKATPDIRYDGSGPGRQRCECCRLGPRKPVPIKLNTSNWIPSGTGVAGSVWITLLPRLRHPSERRLWR